MNTLSNKDLGLRFEMFKDWLWRPGKVTETYTVDAWERAIANIGNHSLRDTGVVMPQWIAVIVATMGGVGYGASRLTENPYARTAGLSLILAACLGGAAYEMADQPLNQDNPHILRYHSDKSLSQNACEQIAGQPLQAYDELNNLVDKSTVAEAGYTPLFYFTGVDKANGSTSQQFCVATTSADLADLNYLWKGPTGWIDLTDKLEPPTSDGLFKVGGNHYKGVGIFSTGEDGPIGVPILGFGVDANGDPTGEVVMFDGRDYVPLELDTGMSLDGSTVSAIDRGVIPAELLAELRGIENQLNAWNIDPAIKTLGYHAENGALGVDLGTGVFLQADGSVTVNTPDGFDQIDGSRVVVDNGQVTSIDGMTLTEGVWVENDTRNDDEPGGQPDSSIGVQEEVIVGLSPDELAKMSDEQKIVAAREMAGDAFEGKTIVGESVEGSVATFFSTYRTTDEYGKSVVRTYTVGGVGLETGEVIPGYTPKELPALHAEGNMPEKFYFDGEQLSQVVDTESALARAQEATYRGVEYPAEITYWQNEAGEIVLVDWPAWPGGPRGLMSYSASQDGRLVELLPVEVEGRLTLENLSADEIGTVFARLMRDQRNADLDRVINDPDGVVIAVAVPISTTSTYWGGDESESPSTAMSQWKKFENEAIFSHTLDIRNLNPPVGVAFEIFPITSADNWRIMATYESGEHVAASLASRITVANQSTTSKIEFDRNFIKPYTDLTKMLKDFGVQVVMFDTDNK